MTYEEYKKQKNAKVTQTQSKTNTMPTLSSYEQYKAQRQQTTQSNPQHVQLAQDLAGATSIRTANDIKQEERQKLIQEMTGGEPSAFVPKTINAQALEDAQVQYEQEKKEKAKNYLPQLGKNITAGVASGVTSLYDYGKALGNELEYKFKFNREASNLFADYLAGDKEKGEEDFKQAVANLEKEKQAEIEADRAKTQWARDNQQAVMEGNQNYSGFGKGLLNAVNTTARMFSTSPLGTYGIFGNAAGGAYNQAMESGADSQKALAYATTSGALETGVETLSGGAAQKLLNVPAISKMSNLTEKITNPFLRSVANVAGDVLGEGGEEVITALLDPYIQKATYNPNAGFTSWSEAMTDAGNAFVESILPTLLMGGTSYVVDGVNSFTNKQIEKIQSSNLPQNEKQQLINQVQQQGEQIIAEQQKNNAPESAQIQETTATNEVIPQEGANQDTANMVQNSANAQKAVQNEVVNTKFKEDLQKFIDKKYTENDEITVLEKTPEYFYNLGFDLDKPVTLNMSKLENIMKEPKGTVNGVNQHGITMDLIEQLPNALSNPLNVIKNPKFRNRYVVITELTDQYGDIVIVPIEMNADGKMEGMKINKINTVYGKENYDLPVSEKIDSYMERNKDYIVYDIDNNRQKNRSLMMNTPPRLQLSNKNDSSASVNNIIQPTEDSVNLPTAEELNKPSQEMIEGAQALTLEERESVSEKAQELFEQLFANENLPQAYKFEMGEKIENATTIEQLNRIKNEVNNYKSDLPKETIDERVTRVNEFLEAQKTKGQQTTKREITTKIMELLEITNRGGNGKALSQIAGEINQLLSEGKLTDSKINEIVDSLPEKVRSINEEYLNEYKDLKKELKERPIYVSESVRKGFAHWSDFNKNNLNKLKITKDSRNITVEQLYTELSEKYKDLFPSDIANAADQLQQISDVVGSIKSNVESVETALIKRYGEEGWQEIQSLLKEELQGIRNNLIKATEPVEYYEGGIKNRSYTGTANKNELVNEFLDVEDLKYQVQSNPSTIRMANETINNIGYERAYDTIRNAIDAGERMNATKIALAERLIQESIKKGDFERATQLIGDVAIIGTELGQAVQAMRLINKMSPQGQLMYLQKVVNRMNAKNNLKNAKRDNKKLKELETKIENGDQIKIGESEIKISKEASDELLKAQTPEEIDLAVEKIKNDLAKQLPVDTFEKLDEWRYLAMLGRPKSHLRNVISNIAMRGTYEVKNEIQRVAEVLAKNVLDERTRTFKKATETVKSFAEQSAKDNLNAIKGEGKISIDTDIKSRRKIFKNELLERARKFNSNALNIEDTVFSKSAYISNLTEYLTANGIKTQQDIDLNPDIVEKGIQFAIKESQKTTFRQYSALANALNQVENLNGASKIIIGGTLPFKKTPINIAKTGASYSPAGLIETLTIETKKLRDGKISGNEYIDRLSQGLTGTLITGLGYLLSDLGILSGAGDEDDEYAEAIGERAPYSINIGKGHYNLSWLSPTAMPLFIGAEIQKAIQSEEEIDLNNIVDFLATTLDPLSEMSMVSSVNDAIKNYGSSETSTGAISSTVGNAISSYTGQYLPGIFADVNKIIDPTVRSTQASKNSKFKAGERFLRQSLNKIPGGSYLLEPATDIWGNEKKRSDSALIRAMDALISPGTYTEKKTTAVDNELLKLYDENSNKDIIPKVPKNYFSANGYKYEMSAKEYTNYKKEYGQTAYKELDKLFKTKEYKEMDSEEKQKAIKEIYEEAQETARYEYGLNPASLLAKYNEEEASKRLLGEKKAEKQQNSGVDLVDFYEAWQAQKDIKGIPGPDGKTLSGSESRLKKEAIDKAVPHLSKYQRRALYKEFGVGESVW